MFLDIINEKRFFFFFKSARENIQFRFDVNCDSIVWSKTYHGANLSNMYVETLACQLYKPVISSWFG